MRIDLKGYRQGPASIQVSASCVSTSRFTAHHILPSYDHAFPATMYYSLKTRDPRNPSSLKLFIPHILGTAT